MIETAKLNGDMRYNDATVDTLAPTKAGKIIETLTIPKLYISTYPYLPIYINTYILTALIIETAKLNGDMRYNNITVETLAPTKAGKIIEAYHTKTIYFDLPIPTYLPTFTFS